jgi:hypothetical protein
MPHRLPILDRFGSGGSVAEYREGPAEGGSRISVVPLFSTDASVVICPTIRPPAKAAGSGFTENVSDWTTAGLTGLYRREEDGFQTDLSADRQFRDGSPGATRRIAPA